jgi:hypothetical protein
MPRALQSLLVEQSTLGFPPVKLIVVPSAHDFPAKVSPFNTIYSLTMLFSAAC